MAQYSRRDFAKALGLGAAAMASSGLAPARKPNLVFILADDLGWRDTDLYGSRYYETPNVDRLATRGMMFDQAYAAAPICSPTRGSILTGLFPARLGITQPVCHMEQVVLQQGLEKKAAPDRKALQCNSVTRLKLEYFTLAEALKEAGYTTGHFGKWHLGREPYDPLHQGFDVDVPHWYGPGPAGSYVAPWKFPKTLNFQGEPGEHLEDRMASEATKFIMANKNRPFYLNYWCFSVHSPWDAKPSLIQKYRAKADSKNPQHNALYAAMVQSMDEAIGRLTRDLDEAGVADNTIIVFFSDNGGVFWAPNAADMGKNSLHPEYMDLPITSNAPLRGGKATLYEGGTREPCIVIWPGVTKPGSRSEQVLSSVDFYPTALEMIGVQKKPDLKLDGFSFVPALRGHAAERPPLFCHYPHYVPATGNLPGTYVRHGDWKLIRFYADNNDQTDRFELYNLKDDLGETNNLAARMPARVEELNALIGEFLKNSHATVPLPNPNYSPHAAHAAPPDEMALFTSDDMA
jgi:arylsulfatase A-like enzyme